MVSAARSQNSTTLGCATTRGTSNAPWVESCGPSRANSTESLCCDILASDRVRHAATHRSATSAPIRMGGNIFPLGHSGAACWMNLTRGTGDADLEAARVRAWLAALASVVLLTPIALLVRLIAKDGEAQRGWLEVLVVIMALPYLGALWRLTWHLDSVGGGRAVGAGWFGVALLCALLVPLPLVGPLALWIWAPLFSPRFLAAVPVIPHLISLIVYLGALIALQSVLIRQGGLLRRRATGHERRRGGLAVVASFGYAALWGVSWWVTTEVGEHQERQRFLALERRSADERAASHPAPPSLDLLWMIDLRRQAHRPFEPPAAPAVAPDGTIYFALDTGLVAIAPGGEVAWRNPAVQA